jgi:signal transduction histidine kinase
MIGLRRTVCFRTFLMITILLVLLPFQLIGAWLIWRNVSAKRVVVETQLQTITATAATATQTIVAVWRSDLEFLALIAVDGNDIAVSARAMNEYLSTHPETQALAVLRSDGSFAATWGRLPVGAISAAAVSMSLPESLGVGSRVTDFVRLSGANGPLIATAVPLHSGTLAQGVLLALNNATQMKLLSVSDDTRLGGQAAIVDQNNVIIADTDPGLVGQAFPLTQEIDSRIRKTDSVFNVVLGGVSTYVATRRSDFAPWFLAYMVPSEVIDAQHQSGFSIVTLLLLLAAPFMASALLGHYLGRRMDRLAEAAAAVSSGKVPLQLPPTGLTEIDVVQQALQQAGQVAQERAAARERLLRMEQALQRAERMESLGQLMAAVSHDFGNLLFTIRGNLEIIQLSLRDNVQVQRIVERPLRIVDEAAELISQLSVGVRQKGNAPKRININEVLREVAGLLRDVAGRSIQVEINFGPGLLDCRLDPNLLKSSLLNLVINARNAMPHGGKIEICTRSVVLSQQAAQAADLPGAGDYVMLSVADTGLGIPLEIRDRIFEPFFTSREGEDGTGLGLSILRGFVKAAGGSVQVDSKTGEGTTFTLLFPIHLTPSDATA